MSGCSELVVKIPSSHPHIQLVTVSICSCAHLIATAVVHGPIFSPGFIPQPLGWALYLSHSEQASKTQICSGPHPCLCGPQDQVQMLWPGAYALHNGDLLGPPKWALAAVRLSHVHVLRSPWAPSLPRLWHVLLLPSPVFSPPQSHPDIPISPAFTPLWC